MNVAIGAAAGKPKADATIWLFRIKNEATVRIGAGENGGRTVTYHNVVREVKAIGIWKGKPVTLDLPRDALGGDPRDEIAVVVQQGGYGRIVGAAKLDEQEIAKGH